MAASRLSIQNNLTCQDFDFIFNSNLAHKVDHMFEGDSATSNTEPMNGC